MVLQHGNAMTEMPASLIASTCSLIVLHNGDAMNSTFFSVRLSFTAANNWSILPPFSLIRDFQKQNTRGNVSKISVNHACYRGQKVTLVAVIGGFRSDLSITCMIDGNFGNVSAGVLFSKVAYQRKRW